MPVEFEMPRDLPDGNYQLFVSDWDTYLQQEQVARPFRFTAESADEGLLGAQGHLLGQAQRALLRLMRQADGVANRPHGDAQAPLIAPTGPAGRGAFEHHARSSAAR
jgi:hypothetical protein